MKTLLSSPPRARALLAYLAMVGATVLAYFLIRRRGEELVAIAPSTASSATREASHGSILAQVLLALAVITLLAHLLGASFKRWLRQPPVIGEIVAGLMLGPSVLGAISPGAYQALLPPESAPYYGLIAKVGVVLFMFLVGLDLNPRLLRGNTHATIAVSHASILAPFLLGTILALWMYPRYSAINVSFTVFSLFLGVSLSVTAFPVLARILTDRGVQRTRLGSTALACAAVDDVSAWTLLALVAGVARSSPGDAARTVVFVLIYVVLMFLLVRPALVPFVARQQAAQGPLSHGALAIVFVLLLLSAVATESIGIHALFGAFLLGAILPHEGRLAVQIRERLEDVVVVLFLPSFFAFTGMRTQVGLVRGAQDWLACGGIVLVATLGKFGGTFVAARLTGLGNRHASALGILMNTRGLMELVVLNLGLDLGVITPTVFTMLVLMALVTTFATTPLLDLTLGRRGFEDGPDPAPAGRVSAKS